MAMALSVEISGLSQAFGRTTVLRDIDLRVGPGVFGLLGPNGAGKTTLLRTLATILEPRQGKLSLLGWRPEFADERRELRRRLGYLPQQLGYYPNFTVFEFVEYFALLKEVPNGEVRPAVARAIQRVGLEAQARSKLKTLSGGMLDEPTAGLDPEQRVSFRSLLREIGQASVVIVSTHLIEDVAAACTEVGLLEQGRIVFRGRPDELSLLGEGGAGDSPLERGYSRVLAEARA
jgi:ABC-type multidrug transport system ATPase subunit